MSVINAISEGRSQAYSSVVIWKLFGVVTKVLATQHWSAFQQSTTWTKPTMFRGRHFGFSAPNPDSLPEPEQTSDPRGHSALKYDPATSVSGESIFESAEEEPRHLEQTGQDESSSPKEQTIEEEPYQETETKLDPLAFSTIIRGELWTEPRPLNSPIKNLFSQLLHFQQMNQNHITTTTTMATPISNRAKQIALNKPNSFNGDRKKFKEFLQSVEVYMDMNHKVYRTDLIKIAFVLSFMNSRPTSSSSWSLPCFRHYSYKNQS